MLPKSPQRLRRNCFSPEPRLRVENYKPDRLHSRSQRAVVRKLEPFDNYRESFLPTCSKSRHLPSQSHRTAPSFKDKTMLGETFKNKTIKTSVFIDHLEPVLTQNNHSPTHTAVSTLSSMKKIEGDLSGSTRPCSAYPKKGSVRTEATSKSRTRVGNRPNSKRPPSSATDCDIQQNIGNGFTLPIPQNLQQVKPRALMQKTSSPDTRKSLIDDMLLQLKNVKLPKSLKGYQPATKDIAKSSPAGQPMEGSILLNEDHTTPLIPPSHNPQLYKPSFSSFQESADSEEQPQVTPIFRSKLQNAVPIDPSALPVSYSLRSSLGNIISKYSRR